MEKVIRKKERTKETKRKKRAGRKKSISKPRNQKITKQREKEQALKCRLPEVLIDQPPAPVDEMKRDNR